MSARFYFKPRAREHTFVEFNGFEIDMFEIGSFKLRYMLKKLTPFNILKTSAKYATSEIRKSIALADVFVFNFKPGKLCSGDTIYLGNFSITETELCLELYISTLESLEKLKKEFQDPYVLLDLDLTLIRTKSIEKEFVPNLKIDGFSIYNGKSFEHETMLRPFVHIFLKKLLEMTPNVCIMTAGDLQYAIEIVEAANKIGWGGGEEPVHFDSKNVFSVRSESTFTNYKSINYVFSEAKKWLAVDDDVGMWDPSLVDHVLKIDPFMPGETTEELLKMLPIIERKLSC